MIDMINWPLLLLCVGIIVSIDLCFRLRSKRLQKKSQATVMQQELKKARKRIAFDQARIYAKIGLNESAHNQLTIVKYLYMD